MDNDIKIIFSHLNLSVDSINQKFATLNVTKLIEPFDGIDSERTIAWLTSVERICDSLNSTEQNKIATLFLCSRGPLSIFLERLEKENNSLLPGQKEVLDFERIKELIIDHFSSITDPCHAYDRLRKIKQYPREPITIFAQRIHDLADFAFPSNDKQNATVQSLIQSRLVDAFIRGLDSKQVKLKVISERCVNMKDAVAVAIDEATLIQRFECYCNNDNLINKN